MAEIDPEIVRRLQDSVRQGASPSAVVRQLSGWLPCDIARTVAEIIYLRAAFGMTLSQASPVGGFIDGTGELSDAQIDELLGPFMKLASEEVTHFEFVPIDAEPHSAAA